MSNAIARNGLKPWKNLKTFMRKRKIVKAVYKLIYWSKKSVQISFFLTFVIKNAIQVYMFYKCPCKFLFLVNVLFFPKLVIVWKIFFQLLARLQTRDNHLDALLWCLFVFSQAWNSQWRRFRVAFAPSRKMEETRASSPSFVYFHVVFWLRKIQ